MKFALIPPFFAGNAFVDLGQYPHHLAKTAATVAQNGSGGRKHSSTQAKQRKSPMGTTAPNGRKTMPNKLTNNNGTFYLQASEGRDNRITVISKQKCQNEPKGFIIGILLNSMHFSAIFLFYVSFPPFFFPQIHPPPLLRSLRLLPVRLVAFCWGTVFRTAQ